MSPKKRVYELAKEYGLSGQELATKLRDLGFSQIKSHMAAMDDFLLLQVQGVLEAHGIISESQGAAGAQSGDGLVVRRKKKKKPAAEEAPAEERPEPAAEPEPAPTAAQPEEEPADEPVREPVVAEVPTPVEPAPAEAPAARAGTAADEAPPAPVEAPAPAPREAEAPRTETPAAEEPTPAAAAPASPPAAVQPAAEKAAEAPAAPEPAAPRAEGKPAASAEAEAPAKAAAEAAADSEDPAEDKDKPTRKGPAGKVVGFVDLSKIKQPAPRKAESRRLRSRDDETPDVKPTLGHDRKRAFMRGDQGSRGQLTAAQLREKEAGRFLRRRAMQGGDRGGRGGHRGHRGFEPASSPHAGGEVKIESPVTIKKLAETLSLKANEVLKKAISQIGFGVNINSVLDEESAVLLASEFSVDLKVAHEIAAEEALIDEIVQARSSVEHEHLEPRPPIVAFLGHVDHGKTTLLDQLRKSRVAQGESGGITQHLGAYQVESSKGRRVTVLDTPGHEAFTRMRARGAEAVDIVVLVVAADDGVMPSTVEAIAHARAAKTPIVVAINKCDKPEASPDKVMNELAGRDLIPEDWGGSTGMVQISALKGDGIDALLDRILLESEVLELNAHPEGSASGVVLEAEVQEGKGRVAYLLIQDGTLNQGDIILAGEGYGRVRSIHDDRNKLVKTAGPATPVEVSGLSELPGVGDHFYVVEKLERAKEVAEERASKNRAMSLADRRMVTKENLLQAVAEQSKKTIDIILKADVQGSLEALKSQVETLIHDEVDTRLVHSALGAVTESDVDLATTSGAMILAFHTSANDKARQAADRAGVEIRQYEVIYEMLDDLKAIMEGSLAPEMTEEVTAHVEVRRVFKSSRLGNIAGCMVLDGTVSRSHSARVLRDGKVVHTGPIGSIRRESDDAKEVREGFECGIVLRDFDGYKEGDVIEAFKMVAVKRLLKI